jgi:hypothetical protein
MNEQQMNGYYSQAMKMSDELYEYMTETFAKTPCVVYCIDTQRWNNHVTVDVWVCIGNGFASDDVREMVGSVSMSFAFAPWRREKTSDFIKQVKNETNDFLLKVINTGGITEKEQ